MLILNLGLLLQIQEMGFCFFMVGEIHLVGSGWEFWKYYSQGATFGNPMEKITNKQVKF